ncbi:MAG: sugar ABC transporter ATP-binding protein [Tepidisphaeraceae bacterium]
MSDDFIRFESITKRFAGVTALSDVTLAIRRGECHALMGENGAGKSTLGKVLAGIHRAEEGRVLIDGVERRFHSPREAATAGIGMVHQELAFCPELSVAENLSMGRYPMHLGLFVRRSEMEAKARELLEQIGVDIDVRRPMHELTTGQEQMVQIAAAVGTGAKILVFDEPTSSLSEVEARRLFALIGQLKQRGVTMIYVSHRLPEVFTLCDRISVLRDGRHVGTLPRAEADENRVVQMMIGRELAAEGDLRPRPREQHAVLEVSGLRSPGKFREVGFTVHAGEILGFAGLVGAGRSEVAQAVFGLDPRAEGVVSVEGRQLPGRSISAAMRAGIGLVPEDRKRQGLVLMMGCRENFSLSLLERFTNWGFLKLGRERADAIAACKQLAVKTATIDTPVAALSGGNQQKVVLTRWLAQGGKILIVDEPTRGVDVGAKAAIHVLLSDLARQGLAIVLISSELPELLKLSTRVLVMREGRMVGSVAGDEATQESLMRLMAGVDAG